MTVNVAVQVFGTSHELVTVKVTVLTPPHASGAPLLLLLKAALQPPEKLTVVSQLANLASMTACD